MISFHKNDKIRFIAQHAKGPVIGITEFKLDECIFQTEIQIDNYDLLRYDRNRNGGGVACYIRSDISYVQKEVFPNVIETFYVKCYCQKLHQ